MQSIKINESLHLEPVTWADAHFLFDLKNEDAAKASAIVTKSSIEWKDHVAWFNRTIKDRNVELYVIVDSMNNRVGSWRFDHFSDHVECSIIVHENHRGKGVAGTVFQFGSDYIAKKTNKPVVGKVVTGNIAPMRYQIKAGFLPTEYVKEGDFYIWRKEC